MYVKTLMNEGPAPRYGWDGKQLSPPPRATVFSRAIPSSSPPHVEDGDSLIDGLDLNDCCACQKCLILELGKYSVVLYPGEGWMR